MHPFEKFRQNLLVKFYSMKEFKFFDTRAETEKNFSVGFVVTQNTESLKLYHVLLKHSRENVFVFRQKGCWSQIHNMLINEEHFGTS